MVTVETPMTESITVMMTDNEVPSPKIKIPQCIFFKKVFGWHMSFLTATGTRVLDFWWCLLWVSKPKWVLPNLLFCRGECYVHLPRSTSGATCADLLTAGIAAGHFLTCIRTSVYLLKLDIIPLFEHVYNWYQFALSILYLALLEVYVVMHINL